MVTWYALPFIGGCLIEILVFQITRVFQNRVGDWNFVKNIGWQIKGSITLGRVKMMFWWLWIKTQTLHAFSLVCWNIIWWHIFLICFCLLGWYQPFLILQMLGRLEIEMTILMGILDKDIDRCYCIYLLVIFYLVLLSNFPFTYIPFTHTVSKQIKYDPTKC